MDPPAEPLGRLASGAVARAYAELHTLIDALHDKDDVQRKNQVVEYALRTRHRIVRLLVATRWCMQLGRHVDSAVNADAAAVARGQVFEDAADALWSVHGNVAAAPMARPAIAPAVDILTSGCLSRLPRVLEAAIGNYASLPPESVPKWGAVSGLVATSDVTEEIASSPAEADVATAGEDVFDHNNRAGRPASSTVTDRLGIATRNSVRESLAHVPGLHVFSWRSGIAGVCVRVGVETMWAADISLDRLDPDTAVLRVHQLEVSVASHQDAAGAPHTVSLTHFACGGRRPAPMSTSQESMMRRMADERMTAAISAVHAYSAEEAHVDRVAVMLCSLRDMMADDVCAPLAMEHLRAQAAALSKSSWQGLLKVEGSGGETPRAESLIVRYWNQSFEPASLRICEYRAASTVPPKHQSDEVDGDARGKGAESDIRGDGASGNGTLSSDDMIGLDQRPSCVTVLTHDPPLAGGAGHGRLVRGLELKMDALDLEIVLLACIRTRACTRLSSLADAVLRKRSVLHIHASSVSMIGRGRSSGDYADDQSLSRSASPGSVTAEDSLCVHLGPDGKSGVEVRVVSQSGGLHIRPYGAAALAVPTHELADAKLWSGARFMSSSVEEETAVLAAVESVRSRVKLSAAARSVCALDIGVSNTLPPGTASVAATASPDRAASQLVPPFAPLERRAPRRFLTLSPPPQAKDALSGLMANASSGNTGSARGGSSARGGDDRGSSFSKRPRLTYATTSDALVFIQESSFAGDDGYGSALALGKRSRSSEQDAGRAPGVLASSDAESVDRYSGTAAAAAAWAVTRDVVERRLRRDSLLRAFVAANVASAAQTHHHKSSDDGDLHLESASRVLLKVKCEPLPVRRAELLLRGNDAWQVRLSLLPPIFDSTDAAVPSGDDGPPSGADTQRRSVCDGNLWSVGVACSGSQLTFTYPSANAASVRSFFRDLTRARTAAALARGVPPSPFYRVLRRSPVRIVVGIGPFNTGSNSSATAPQAPPLYTATVEYVYSRGNSGGFSLSFSPSKKTMEELSPLIEEALDASGGQVGGILAGLLERACPVAAAAESAVRERGNGRIRFVTALRVRAVFPGVHPHQHQKSGGMQHQASRNRQPQSQVVHAVDVDARGGGGLVTVIDVGRATAVMIQQGFAHRGGSSGSGAGGSTPRRPDFMPIPKWDEIVASLSREGHAEAQRAGSTVVLRMQVLEQFLTALVSSALLA